jgi:hypothetical protein
MSKNVSFFLLSLLVLSFQYLYNVVFLGIPDVFIFYVLMIFVRLFLFSLLMSSYWSKFLIPFLI